MIGGQPMTGGQLLWLVLSWYLVGVPGGVVLLRWRAQLLQARDAFYAAARGGATLDAIESAASQVTAVARGGAFAILRIQGAALLLLWLAGPALAQRLGLSAPVLHLGAAALSLQLGLLWILDVLLNLALPQVAAGLGALLLSLCAGLAGLLHLAESTRILGSARASAVLLPAVLVTLGAVLVTLGVGGAVLRRRLSQLVFRTFTAG